MIDIGSVVNGKYKLVRLLGEGGMGSVYEAVHAVLGTRVAIKVLHPELGRRTGLVERFLQEARVAAQIRSAHVVQVTDVDRTPEGHAYIVMELLEGEPLSTILDRQHKLAVPNAADFTLQILEALEAAHALGVIHRDLKPENVFLTYGSGKATLKLIDFGIAKARRTDPQQRNLTVAGVVMGTAEYMAPEQARSADKVDARSDLYAVGVMLYEMIAGSRPVTGEDARIIATRVERGEVIPLVKAAPEVPREIAGLVHRAMAARPELRFASATEMRIALENVMAGKRPAMGSLPGVARTPLPAGSSTNPPDGGMSAASPQRSLQMEVTGSGTLRDMHAVPMAQGAHGTIATAQTPMGMEAPEPAPHTQRAPPLATALGPAPYAAVSVPSAPAGSEPRARGRNRTLALVALPLLLGAGIVGDPHRHRGVGGPQQRLRHARADARPPGGGRGWRRNVDAGRGDHPDGAHRADQRRSHTPAEPAVRDRIAPSELLRSSRPSRCVRCRGAASRSFPLFAADGRSLRSPASCPCRAAFPPRFRPCCRHGPRRPRGGRRRRGQLPLPLRLEESPDTRAPRGGAPWQRASSQRLRCALTLHAAAFAPDRGAAPPLLTSSRGLPAGRAAAQARRFLAGSHLGTPPAGGRCGRGAGLGAGAPSRKVRDAARTTRSRAADGRERGGAIAWRWVEGRRLRAPEQVVRNLVRGVDREAADKALRALSLVEGDGAIRAEGTSAALASLHVERALGRLPSGRVLERAASAAGWIRTTAVFLAIVALGVGLANVWSVLEGADVLVARRGVAPGGDELARQRGSGRPAARLLARERAPRTCFSSMLLPYGTTLTVRGVPLHAGRRLLLGDGEAEVPFVEDGAGALVARWQLTRSTSLRVVARFGAVVIPEGEALALESIADEVPAVRLEGAPRQARLIDEDADLPLQYEASDDHGLHEVHLVLRSGTREERRVLARLDGDTKVDRGGHVLKLRDPFLTKSHAPIRVTIEAKDNDPLLGPKWGSSEAITLIPPDVGEPQARRLEALRKVRDALVDSLAWRLGTTRRRTSGLERHSWTRRGYGPTGMTRS